MSDSLPYHASNKSSTVQTIIDTPRSNTMSPIQSHKSRSSTGSLSRANSTGAALRRGELQISDPIPIPREGIDGLGPQTGVGSPDFQSTTSLRSPKVLVDRNSGTRTEAPPLPLRSSPSAKYKSSVNGSQDFAYISHQTKVSTSNPHDSMSSTQSKPSIKKKRKDSTLKSVMRKLFGSKRGDEYRKSSSSELRSVSVCLD